MKKLLILLSLFGLLLSPVFAQLQVPAVASSVQTEVCDQNLLIWSEELDQVIWEKSNITVLADQANDMLGNPTLERITFSWSTNWVQQLITVVAETTYRFSFEAKRGTATEAHYGIEDVDHFNYIIESTSYYNDINADNPVRIEVEFITPVGCTSIKVCALFDTPIENGTMFIGRAQLEENGSCYITTTTDPITP